MNRTSASILIGTAIALFVTGCGYLASRPSDITLCADLFRRGTPESDSIAGPPHVPPEAAATSELYVTPQPTALLWQQIDCSGSAIDLPVERIIGVPSNHKAFYRLSPSGRRIAIQQYGEDRLVVLDQLTGEKRAFTASGVPFFWTGESHLFFNDSERPGGARWYRLDTESGETTPFGMRWEYDEPDLSRFTMDLYTGWQAARALQVPDDAICAAVQEGVLQVTPAGDGSLLLMRDELLDHGPDVVRREYDELVTSEEVTQMRQGATNGIVISRFWRDAPLVDGYENQTWKRLLVLAGLPDAPQNLIVHVAREDHWDGYRSIPNQQRIAAGGIRDGDVHPSYLVSADLCPADKEEEFVLFAKEPDGKSLTALGTVPFETYVIYNQEGDSSSLDWSPEGNFIYMADWSGGQYTVHRLRLPQR